MEVSVFEEYITKQFDAWQQICEFNGDYTVEEFDDESAKQLDFLIDKKLVKIIDGKLHLNDAEPIAKLMEDLYHATIKKSLEYI